MKGLRNKFERFCYKYQKIGIPNLMLFVSIGTAVVHLMNMLGFNQLMGLLVFDRALILQGEVWRLVTYIFTFDAGFLPLTLIALLCYYSLGRAMENIWGTLRFNLFYFTGMLLMGVYCMIFGGRATIGALNNSLFLAYATLYPNARFLLLFFIPIPAWVLAMIELIMTVLQVVVLLLFGEYIAAVYPLLVIGNYLLFFGKDVVNVVPMSWRMNLQRLFRKRTKAQKKAGTVPFPTAGSYEATTTKTKAPYTHRCVVCGRTDVSNPELEFRYCSRCKGYFCYCEDHINNHNHVE